MLADRPNQRRRTNNHQEPVEPLEVPQPGANPVLPVPVRPEADLTYAQMVLQSQPQDPPHEVYAPVLVRACFHPTHAQVVDAEGRLVDTSDARAPPPIALVGDEAHPAFAYAFLPDFKPIQLKHEQGWGEVRFAVAYPHHENDPPHVFRAPDPRQGSPSYVAIKILNKAIVQRHLAQGGRENPYKEICRYQELGDNVHVIMCKAMEDNDRLFIITPKAEPLVNKIFGRSTPMPAQEVHGYVVQMLQILSYLAEKYIHHRDFSPDNLFILPDGQLVLTDMAMSLRIPKNADGSRRTLIKHQGTFGTAAWMAPEIFNRFPFDGVTADLWCVMHIAYNCLTGHLLYRRPHPTDWCYLFFVMTGALTTDALNEQAMEALQEIAENAGAEHLQQLQEQAMAHMAFGPRVREFLSRVLKNAPHERATLGDCLRSAYIVNGPD